MKLVSLSFFVLRCRFVFAPEAVVDEPEMVEAREIADIDEGG
jgi:hypothetical protein